MDRVKRGGGEGGAIEPFFNAPSPLGVINPKYTKNVHKKKKNVAIIIELKQKRK